MKQLYAEALVQAPPADVFRVLVDLSQYRAWNPHLIEAAGDVAEGKSFRYAVRLFEGWTSWHRAKTLRLIPGREWIYRDLLWGMPGLLDAEICIQLVPDGPARTHVLLKEHFQGLFLPLFWTWFTSPRIIKGGEMMNQALKRAVESGETLNHEAQVVTQFNNRDRAALERLRGSWALVTGASSGIGREFARQLAALGMPIALVARGREGLEKVQQELRERYSVETLVLPADLAEVEARRGIQRALHARGIKIRILVNAAGWDDWNYFDDMSPESCRALLRVNAEAPMDLCHLFREDLGSHLTSAVINLASLAALQPVPYMAPYASAKAFILNFSQALYGEWLQRGIVVQTLLPGPTDTNAASLRKLIAHGLFKDPMDPAEVVRQSLKHLERRSPVVIAGTRPIFHRLFAALMPARFVIMTLAGRFRLPASRRKEKTGSDSGNTP